VFWLLAAGLTVACFAYQDKTRPTYPLEGQLATPHGTVSFKLLRSETIGNGLTVALLDPVPEGIGGHVTYRRYKSDDPWSTLELTPGTFTSSRRGRIETVTGVGAVLPSLQERAGKYEYRVFVDSGDGEPVSITGEQPILARYKGAVPTPVLIAHILAIFLSMTIAIRTLLEAIVDGSFRWMIWASIISLLLGGFLLGPLVQLYAFGVWWSGIPFGYDWTDNKVLLELVFWLLAAWRNRGSRRDRRSVYLAGAATLLVYFIPHSLFGSEYDYRIGSGHGTAG
jgi:hypothetical protein